MKFDETFEKLTGRRHPLQSAGQAEGWKPLSRGKNYGRLIFVQARI